MTLDELESSWASLQAPAFPEGISGRRAAGLPPDRPVYLAVDNLGRRHLLVQVPDATAPISQRETRSLEVTTARFQVGSNPEAVYVDLACTDSAQFATFSAVAQDLIRSLRHSQEPLRDSIINALARWRAFWSAKGTGMSREEALGLFGELWFLRRWLRPVNAEVISRWQATDAARHDFQWHSASVEVKTAAMQSAAAPVHHIASLDQLADPEQGQLFLFSLQVCDDALAANTLHSLVNSLIGELQNDFQALSALNEKLAARGYSPADSQAPVRSLRILAERFYRVDGEFPRLLRTTFEPLGIPNGVAQVSYSLNLAACENWLVAVNPEEATGILEGC
ncbi:MAG: PD-(D/E)XK motif protein [Betaproteobacteria bacterium]|nr:PD-(D/E)XK motif protein [Betaproteobacteria bacterium]